jgi:flagellar hook-associated protein 3 FlgL
MRISTGMIYDTNVTAMNQQQTRLLQTQQQMATGRRLLTPSIDPAAAAQALVVAHSDATNTQYTVNRSGAKNTFAQMDTTLQGVASVLQDVRTTMVSASTGSYNNTERQNIASSLSVRLDELVSLANSTDASGNFMFSGFQSQTQPIANTAAGYAYLGDDGKKMTQVSDTLQVASSLSGADIFMRVKNGNGAFVTQAAAANTGNASASIGSVTNPTLLTGNSYSLAFTVAAGVTSYSVTNTTTGLPVAGMTAQPYVSGQAISFDGMQFAVQGTPANGDSLSVAASSNVSIFKTIADAIALLNTPVLAGNTAQLASLGSGVTSAINQLDRGLNVVATALSTVGTNWQSVDATQAIGDNLSLGYKQTLSQLQDADVYKASTDLQQQLVGLQAAQKSFMQVSNLSLFTFM